MPPFLLGVIAGHDPREFHVCKLPVPDYLKALKKKRFEKAKGRCPRPSTSSMGSIPEVEQAVRTAIEELRELGADIRGDQVADDGRSGGDLLCDCHCRGQLKFGTIRRSEVRYAGEGE